MFVYNPARNIKIYIMMENQVQMGKYSENKKSGIIEIDLYNLDGIYFYSWTNFTFDQQLLFHPQLNAATIITSCYACFITIHKHSRRPYPKSIIYDLCS